MNKRVSVAVMGAVLAIAGFAGDLLVKGSGVAQAADAPAKMTPKEPVASPEEFKARVIHHDDLPMTELVPGANSQLIAGEQSMISFLKMDKHSYFAPHRHVQEQIMIVLDGYCDEIIEGKLYRVKKGDVIVLPSNIEHGAYMYDEDVHVIDVFGEVRADYLVKMLQVMATMNTKANPKK